MSARRRASAVAAWSASSFACARSVEMYASGPAETSTPCSIRPPSPVATASTTSIFPVLTPSSLRDAVADEPPVLRDRRDQRLALDHGVGDRLGGDAAPAQEG